MRQSDPEVVTIPPDRWQQVAKLCDSALDLEPAIRPGFLDEACGSDRQLRDELEALLAGEEQAAEFLELPALELAASVLGGEEPQPAAEPLPGGLQIGPYRVVARIGSGGMGDVYRATDIRLERDVALKFLSAGSAHHWEALERFRREARAASALSHPNICHLYDIGEYDGQPFLVMELLEGRSLKERVGSGPFPPQEVVELAIQVADALDTAHARGVIHRDIKPGNILVTARGQAKILDFGVAKLLSESMRPLDADPEIPARDAPAETGITIPGRTMGTVAYMSPEQARGEDVDPRSDLFSLGVVLYQLATGTRPFEADTPDLTVEAILARQPIPPKKRNPAVPKRLERIILKSLEKDRAARYQKASDVCADLKRVGEIGLPARWLVSAAALLFLAIAATAGLTFGWFNYSRSPTPPALKRLTSDSGLATDPVLSPDGKLLAYASDRAGESSLDIYVRQVAGGEPVRLTRDSADEHEPAFSPDGTKIAFRSERKENGIYLVSTLGSPARRIAADGRRPQFSPDGNWIAYWIGHIGGASLAAGNSKIYLVASGGGEPRQIRADFSAAAYPIWSPDGKYLLFLGNRDDKLSQEKSIDWWVTPLDAGPATRTGVLEATWKQGLTGSLQVYPRALVPATWLRDSIIFSARSGDSTNLWRVGISTKSRTATGSAQRMTSGPTLEMSPFVTSGPGGAVRVAFASLSENLDIWSLPFRANEGKVTGELVRLTQDTAADFHAALSPDGRKMVFLSVRSGSDEVWIKDLRNSEESVLTDSSTNKWYPIFTADGSRVGFSSYLNQKWDIFTVPVTGGVPEMICEDCGALTAWSVNGKGGLYNTLHGRLNLLDIGSRSKAEWLAKPGLYLCQAHFSPDRRWITILAVAGASSQVYALPVPIAGPIQDYAWSAITDGKSFEDKPRWSPDGRLIYFTSDRDGFRCIWAQRLEPSMARPLGAAFPVFHSHDSRRSLMNMDIGRLEIFVAHDRIVLGMGERTGNIWMAEWRDWQPW